MATSFLSRPPQPGDGVSLLHKLNKPLEHGQVKVPTFLRAGQEATFEAEARAMHVSVLQTSGKERPSSAMNEKAPRTIAEDKLKLSSSPRATTSTSFKAEATFNINPSHTTRSNYTHAKNNNNNLNTSGSAEVSSMETAEYNRLPPHLRKHHLAKATPPPPSMEEPTNLDVRDRLAEMGVTISPPRPVKTPAGTRIASQTRQHPRKCQDQASSLRSTSHVRGDISTRRATPFRADRWPKKAEFPKPDPTRWDIDWRSVKEGFCSSIDSVCADSGCGANKKKREGNGARLKLEDWNGGWAPAPLDWDARPAFRDSQTASQIERWMEGIEEDMCGIAAWAVSGEVDGGHAAPRYWVPIVIGKQSPKTFWSELLKAKTPMPFEEGDLDAAKPWWEQYSAPDCDYLKPYEHPLITGVDPDENDDERIARENDRGANYHTDNRRRTEKAKRDAQRERRKKVDKRARQAESKPAIHLDRIKPTLANMYVRRVRATDIPQITDIYNHYVNFSACTPETSERTVQDMHLRYQDIVQHNKLPYVVACERGGKLPQRRKNRHADVEDVILPERVVGFAFADDYNDMQGLYRFTAELEVFTHKGHYMKGVAKCLLDKLMALLDPGYVERGGFEIHGEDLVGVGPARVITNVLVNLPYEKPERLEWVGRWLEKFLGFKQVADVKDIGSKHGKSVSLAIFQRKTGAVIDAANPPIAMSYPS